jgi:hypothetical protein
MKRAYLIRYGAYGDHVHLSNVIKALDEEGWHITFEYNYKGTQIHNYNPRIDKHEYLEPSQTPIKSWTRKIKALEQQYDLVVSFQLSLETALIEPEHKPSYFWSLKARRAKNTHICYYDQSMKWAGLTDEKYMGWNGEIFYPAAEHEHVKKQLDPYKDKFVILWALRGTMWQKAVCHIAKDICNEWLRRHPDSVIITTGDDFCQKWEWVSETGTTIAPDAGLGEGDAALIHKSARMPFRQALLISKYVDLVVTPETGLGIGAGAYGTPKVMLMTAASLKNIVGNDKNDFSLQSDAWCSPCTRAIYNTDNCPINPETQLPICVDFTKDRVLGRMQEVYDKHGMYNLSKRNDAPDGRPVYM